MPKPGSEGHGKFGHLSDRLRRKAPQRYFTFTFSSKAVLRVVAIRQTDRQRDLDLDFIYFITLNETRMEQCALADFKKAIECQNIATSCMSYQVLLYEKKIFFQIF